MEKLLNSKIKQEKDIENMSKRLIKIESESTNYRETNAKVDELEALVKTKEDKRKLMQRFMN